MLMVPVPLQRDDAGKCEIFFTARFARDAGFAKRTYIFFSADPRAIGFALHGAGRPEKKESTA